MKVWIDHDMCMGAGTCADVAPALFTMGRDGLAYVTEGGRLLPGGPQGLGRVPAGMEDEAIEAAEACPGECIFIQVD